jgi:hypothetical protein
MQSFIYGCLDEQMKFEWAMNILYNRKNLPMREKESLNRYLMRLSEQLLELVSVFKEGNKNFIDFSLELSRLNI